MILSSNLQTSKPTNGLTTPGNDIRGNQNYANEILTGASGHELQSVDRMPTNLLSHYWQISKRENRQFVNVVPNSFHFYTSLIKKKITEKQAVNF